MGRRRRLLIVGALVGALTGAGGLAGCGGPAAPASLSVLTRNLDEGTDFGALLQAKSAAEFLTAAATAWHEVQASDIPGRAAAVADEIAAERPDVVSIQEASIWRTGPLLKGPAPNLVYDALSSLRSALAARGAHYRLVARESEFDLEGPTSLGYDVRVSDEDAILARSDVPVSGARAGHFARQLTISAVGLEERIVRGWTSVEVSVGGRPVRFVGTHLESFSDPVQLAQAQELVAGPAAGREPTIVACDCNSGPGVMHAYEYLVGGGGLTDAWSAVHPRSAGLTWALHGEDPYTPTAVPSQRIDLVLYKGPVRAKSARLVGTRPVGPGAPALWASDHAGVVARLEVG